MAEVFSSKNLALQTIKNRIEYFISSGIFHDLDEFIAANPDLTSFQNHTKLNNTLKKVWGYRITEEEYQAVLEELKRELQERMQIKMDDIKTVKAGDKELVTYQGEEGTVVLDNSYNPRDFDKQLEDLQKNTKDAQIQGENNIDTLMNEMQDRIKPEETQMTMTEAAQGNLNREEKENLMAAKQYEQQSDSKEPIQVDLKDGIIVDDGEVKSIEKREDGIGVYDATETGEKLAEQDNKSASATKNKVKQKTLTRNNQAGFSNAFILVFVSGVVLGIMVLSVFMP